MDLSLELFRQLAHGLAIHFGDNCEIVLHNLTTGNIESSIIIIENGHITNRKIGDGPSHVVLEALRDDHSKLEDHLGYLTKTADGRILKSSTMYIRNENKKVTHIFSINYDITSLLLIENSLGVLIGINDKTKEPEKITRNVSDLLEDLIEQSVKIVGKPVALMNKEEKVNAIRFLNDSGAFLITKSGDKISKYFGISKYTLYSYIDINK
jgi:predicted transcriptional regulator YheO